ncbi:unnamed protein product [Echinostoma caproni]|uniref:CUB domain-containing protein n=1 Tax=Echinostoma caproni TaxID=27848 RepID=A0A3P8HJH2_9TREM|nr:unnamed protein product [Echinostoma caproni]
MTKLQKPWKVPAQALTEATTCDYTLTGTAGKKYQLQITELKVGTSDTCTEDFVQVSFNGKFDGDTYKVCGTNAPQQPLVSTSHEIKVKFKSSLDNAATNSLTATITEVPDQGSQDPKCGEAAVDLTKLQKPWKVPAQALTEATT